MRKIYPTKIEMVRDLSEKANVDYELTLKARHNSFFTKDGVGYSAAVFPSMVKLLNEYADANLKEDECFSLSRGYILTFKQKSEDVVVNDNVETLEVIDTDKEEKPKSTRGRKATK